MKTPVLHFMFLALLGSFFTPPAVAYASPSLADSVHFSCQIIDPEEWERERALLPAAKRLQDLNVGEPRTVRLFYLLPNDRTERPEVVAAMKTGILEIQSFYREQMAAHGYGNKTFQIETDAEGVPIVNRVDGQSPASAYGNMKGEIAQAFDNSANIILIVIDSPVSSLHGQGTGTKDFGWAMIYGGWNWFVAAHELGHTFGLHHDFRDDAYIMSYGRANRSSAQLSACAAEFLSVHPYLNPDVPLENESPPTIELISPTEYLAGSESVPVRLRVRNDEGLHQVILFVNTKRALGVIGPEVKACRGLAGETDTIVEFNYDGKTPSDRVFSGSPIYTSFSDPLQHKIYVVAVDTDGNRTNTFSPISFTLTMNAAPPVFTDGVSTTRAVTEDTAEGQNIGTAIAATDADNNTLTYSLSGPDAAAFNIVRETGQLRTKALLDYETKTTYAVTVTVSDGVFTDTITVTIIITDVADTPQDFGLTPVSDRTPQVRDAILGAVRLDFPTISNYASITVSHLSGITLLDLSRTNITSLKAGDFDGLTALTTLYLSNNQFTTLPAGIFDRLTALTTLYLSNNQFTTLPAGIFDRLTALTTLYLSNNQFTTLPEGIFDSLTALTTLRLNDNQLTTLPEGIFDSLTALTTFEAYRNQLTTLPAGIFDNLTALTTLDLRFNRFTMLPAGIFDGLTAVTKLWLNPYSRDPLPLTVSLEKVGGDQFKATAPTGAPFDIILPLRVTNGSIDGGATTITIPVGSRESAPLTVTRTPGTTAAVTVDIGTLPELPPNHKGYALAKSSDLPLEVTLLAGICGRTEEVQTAILGAISGVSDCALVTDAHLAAISGSFEVTVGSSLKAGDFEGLTGVTVLGIESEQLTSLPAGVFNGLSNVTYIEWYDSQLSTLPAGAFDGLTNLTTLGLVASQLSTLPAGAFDGLTNLTGLALVASQLSTLPAGVFDNLTNLTSLELYAGQLSTLPDGIFDQLTNLTTLELGGTQLTSLPDGIFDQLTALTELDLSDNQLATLPDGLFSGLSSLTTLRLQGNSVDPLPLTVSLEKIGIDQFKAVAPTGAPFDIVLPLSVTNGSINGGATTITIPVGSVESETLTVSGTTFAVTVNIGDLPGLPTDTGRYGIPLHQGYTLVKSADLPLIFTNLGGAVFTPVCDRTPQVRDQIVERSPVSACGDVTEAHLAAIEGLLLGQITIIGETAGEEVTGLKAGDFDGLTGLTALWVAGEQLSSVPAGVFDELRRPDRADKPHAVRRPVEQSAGSRWKHFF